VTGYGFNLVVLPYNFPSSGNTIINSTNPATSGSTNPNELTLNQRGIYWNSIDTDGIDRTNYFSQFTGQSVTITMTQTGSTAIYSGDSQSLKYWTTTGDTGFVFGTGINVPPGTGTTGTTVLIQSASTNWVTGQTVYISVVNNSSVTPTPTPTPTNTPTESGTTTPVASETPTPTPTVTPTSSLGPAPTNTVTPTPTSSPSVAPSGFTVTIVESGSDVVMTASGSLNINDLTYITTTTLGGSGIGVNTATFIMGSNGDFDTYSGFTSTPSDFGTGGGGASTSSSGDIFGVIFQGTPPYELAVPKSYVTGSAISSTQTFSGETFGSLGLIPGTYTYTWGSGANADSINVIIS
jgi:hypothetical protein